MPFISNAVRIVQYGKNVRNQFRQLFSAVPLLRRMTSKTDICHFSFSNCHLSLNTTVRLRTQSQADFHRRNSTTLTVIDLKSKIEFSPMNNHFGRGTHLWRLFPSFASTRKYPSPMKIFKNLFSLALCFWKSLCLKRFKPDSSDHMPFVILGCFLSVYSNATVDYCPIVRFSKR